MTNQDDIRKEFEEWYPLCDAQPDFRSVCWSAWLACHSHYVPKLDEKIVEAQAILHNYVDPEIMMKATGDGFGFEELIKLLDAVRKEAVNEFQLDLIQRLREIEGLLK